MIFNQSYGVLNMGKKTMKTIFVLAALLIALLAVQVFALPDNAPTCSLSSNTYDTESVAVLTAVSVDTLANAGVDSIKIYEDGNLISTKNCGLTSTCVSVKTVVHTTEGNRDYYAVCRDRSGQQTTSSDITVHFDGLNLPPVIDTAEPDSPLSMAEDETVTFSVTAHDPDGDDLTYEWRVDSETQAGEEGTSFDFSRDVLDTREFSVAVFVRDGNGGMDAHAWEVTVNDAGPDVTLTGDTGLTECDTFEFTAEVDTIDDIVSYDWDFGDGTSSSGTSASVTHQFPSDGTYTVTVTVEDVDGDVDSATFDVTVADISPDVNAGPDQIVVEGETAFFSGNATMPCSMDIIQNYTWDFGDGSPTESGPALRDVSHVFVQDGTYIVTLTVCDEDSCSSDDLTVTVDDTGPTADFDYTPADPEEGEVVDFTDTSVSYDPLVSWEWDFDGDGVTDSNDQNPQWTFDEDGVYEVCLTVEDEDGDTDTHCEDVNVSNVVPVVDLQVDPTSGIEDLDVHADCSATGGNPILQFVIDFGDGSLPANSSSADHNYAQNGTYTVTCTVFDADGDMVTDSVDVVVFDTEPVVDFTWSPAFPAEDEDIFFDATASAYDGIVSYEWDFDDDGIIDSNVEDPVHVYPVGGDYVVSLTVTDGDGSVVTVQHTISVAVNPPDAELYVDPLSGDEPLTVDLTCLGIGGDQPYNITIDFGDSSRYGENSTTAPVSTTHEYTESGIYNVTCTVWDVDGDCRGL
jgi:PKD repeat protein